MPQLFMLHQGNMISIMTRLLYLYSLNESHGNLPIAVFYTSSLDAAQKDV